MCLHWLIQKTEFALAVKEKYKIKLPLGTIEEVVKLEFIFAEVIYKNLFIKLST